MKYYIYHIPNIKIGCTTNLKRRITEQGFTDYEILEEHEDIDIASIREKELQKEYGYRLDGPSYSALHKSREKSFLSPNHGWKKQGLKNVESGHLSRIGRIGGAKVGKMMKDSGKWYQMSINAGKTSTAIEYFCEECQKTIKGPSAFKHKKAFNHNVNRK